MKMDGGEKRVEKFRFASLTFWEKEGRAEIPYHVKINGFANGWWVDPEEWGIEKKVLGDKKNYENFEIVIEFTLQKWFEIGWLISGITLFVSLTFVGICFLKGRKHF